MQIGEVQSLDKAVNLYEGYGSIEEYLNENILPFDGKLMKIRFTFELNESNLDTLYDSYKVQINSASQRKINAFRCALKAICCSISSGFLNPNFLKKSFIITPPKSKELFTFILYVFLLKK